MQEKLERLDDFALLLIDIAYARRYRNIDAVLFRKLRFAQAEKRCRRARARVLQTNAILRGT